MTTSQIAGIFEPMEHVDSSGWVVIGTKRFRALNLPPCPLDWRKGRQGDTLEVKCLARKRFVALEPEEWVRQHWLNYLATDLEYPLGLTSIEHALDLNGQQLRADIVCFDRRARPLVMVECKQPEIALSKDTLDQILRYHLALKTPILIISNGIDHKGFAYQNEQFASIEAIPAYVDRTS